MSVQKQGLEICQFGSPILRSPVNQLSQRQILSKPTQSLITDMIATLRDRKLGVGLAAPQVGKDVAVAVVSIHPTPHRPKVTPFDLVIINPKLMAVKGRKKAMWEGCISSGEGQAGLFARVPRYQSVQVQFYDELGKQRLEWFSGLPAHVLQHEIDHLHGTSFVDKVTDTRSYMTYREYKKHRVKLQAENNYENL